MSFSFNQQILLGYVGQDAELRYSQAGNAVATFSVATSRRFNEEDQTTWHRCVAFKKIAEFAGEGILKGDLVFVRGETRHREYEKDGIKKWATEIIVHELIRCTKREDSPSGTGEAPVVSEQTEKRKGPSATDSAPDDGDLPF
jgi:single-strand DNA-binding protein